MPNLLNNKISFKTAPSNFLIAVSDAPNPEGPKRRRFDMKEVQRRAFERGVAVERAKYSKTLGEMLELVKTQSAQLESDMISDREKIEAFAVRLSLLVAENLTRTIIDQDQHDVVQMVRDLLDEVDGETRGKGLVLKLNPADHGALLDAAANTEIDITGIETVPDPQTEVASPRLIGGDTEYYAKLTERLEQIRSSMIEESQQVHA